MATLRLFHISEEAGIAVFRPRPSPSYFSGMRGEAVFAISERLLHNYLLPRDCPRVCWYANPFTTALDRNRWMGPGQAEFIIAVESRWYAAIVQTKLYCYEFAPAGFTILDETAGYYVSYETAIPLAEREITDIPGELLQRKVELRFLPELGKLADAIRQSSLSFSLIRMRNAGIE